MQLPVHSEYVCNSIFFPLEFPNFSRGWFLPGTLDINEPYRCCA